MSMNSAVANERICIIYYDDFGYGAGSWELRLDASVTSNPSEILKQAFRDTVAKHGVAAMKDATGTDEWTWGDVMEYLDNDILAGYGIRFLEHREPEYSETVNYDWIVVTADQIAPPS
jgi:hypothetical protein